jgi:hypothetical protein
MGIHVCMKRSALSASTESSGINFSNAYVEQMIKEVV